MSIELYIDTDLFYVSLSANTYITLTKGFWLSEVPSTPIAAALSTAPNTHPNTCDLSTAPNTCDLSTAPNTCDLGTTPHTCDISTAPNTCDFRTTPNTCDLSTAPNTCERHDTPETVLNKQLRRYYPVLCILYTFVRALIQIRRTNKMFRYRIMLILKLLILSK